jgi:hypothetical protein
LIESAKSIDLHSSQKNFSCEDLHPLTGFSQESFDALFLAGEAIDGADQSQSIMT